MGVTNALSKEVLTNATQTTKQYAYNVFGQRATISEGTTPNRYSYLYDPHGSVSLLIDQGNTVKESYGYTACGSSNGALTKSESGFNNQSVPKNPYRYTGKRLDSRSGTYDMGARRYSASTGRFLQYDVFHDALENFGLSRDPLAQNRYALAGSNPITFVEIDGHFAAPYVTGEGGATNTWAQYNALGTTCRDWYTCTDNNRSFDWGGFGDTICTVSVACSAVRAAIHGDSTGVVLSVAPGGSVVRGALRAARVGRVARGGLNDIELGQARDFVHLRGGSFRGASKAHPGVDGWLNGKPVSFKNIGTGNPRALVREANRARKTAAAADVSGVQLVIHAERLSAKQVTDFARGGTLGKIPSAKGTIKRIYVKTRDGWVVING